MSLSQHSRSVSPQPPPLSSASWKIVSRSDCPFWLIAVTSCCNSMSCSLLNSTSNGELSWIWRAFLSFFTSFPFFSNFFNWLAGERYFNGRVDDDSVHFSLWPGEAAAALFIVDRSWYNVLQLTHKSNSGEVDCSWKLFGLCHRRLWLELCLAAGWHQILRFLIENEWSQQTLPRKNECLGTECTQSVLAVYPASYLSCCVVVLMPTRSHSRYSWGEPPTSKCHLR